MPRNTALDEEGSEWPWREMSQVDSSGGEIGGCVWGGWAEEVGAHSQPPGELEQGGPVRDEGILQDFEVVFFKLLFAVFNSPCNRKFNSDKYA